MKNLMKRLFVEEAGQGMVEYGLLIAAISVVVIAAVVTLGTWINGKFEAINTELKGE